MVMTQSALHSRYMRATLPAQGMASGPKMSAWLTRLTTRTTGSSTATQLAMISGIRTPAGTVRSTLRCGITHRERLEVAKP